MDWWIDGLTGTLLVRFPNHPMLQLSNNPISCFGYGRLSRIKQKTHDRCQPWVLVEIQFNNDKRQRRR